jgi:hypothetical protein
MFAPPPPDPEVVYVRNPQICLFELYTDDYFVFVVVVVVVCVWLWF